MTKPQLAVEAVRFCIFCGSSPDADPGYLEHASELARRLVARGIGLVYGGARVGTMGALADSALEAGGEVIGVIPRGLVDRELAHPSLSRLEIVETMHERKALMAELSSGFITLPGGAGTLDEFFEAWTWAQLGLHRKPCGVLNARRYFGPLLRMIERMVAEGFMKPDYRDMLVVEEDPDDLIDRLLSYTPPVEKWADRPTRSSA